MSVYVLRFLTQHIYGTDCLAQENVCSSFYNTKKKQLGSLQETLFIGVFRLTSQIVCKMFEP